MQLSLTQITRYQRRVFVLFGVCIGLTFAAQPVHAITPLPTPDPKPGSFGVEATKTKEPPAVAATVAVPGSGASFSTSPITVSGTCQTDLLVQVFNNGVMVGSVLCVGGSYSLQVSLFAGINEITAIVYDELDQPGPASNVVTVTYTDTRFTSFGQLVTLTSSYGRRATPAGSQLTWPFQLTGGVGPYALSIDWGDGSKAELKSQTLAGLISLAHAYKKAGIYTVNINATDANGVTAFLQVVAVSSGKVDATPEEETVAAQRIVILWIPAAAALFLLPLSFWFGRRSQIISLRKKMLKERDTYAKKQEKNSQP